MGARLNQPCTVYHSFMRLLEALADAFYRTFGITEPAEHARRRAALFFLFLLLVIPVAILLAGSLVATTLRR